MSLFRRPSVRLVLAAGAAGLLLPAVPALGNNVVTNVINCDGGRCEGTNDRDTIVASNKPEQIFGNGGDDDIELDAAFPSGSIDVAYGGHGRYCIDGGGGGELMIGRPGDDNPMCELLRSSTRWPR